ncbi:MAG: HEAT repeat domain-containing protein [Bacteroidetes bacterium]|nr:HEAT repeat domain-containing protein [Bacteroidota bacterium]
MKKSFILLSVLLSLVLVMPASAKEPVIPAGVDITAAEDNLLFGLSSSNTGVQRSCALMLGKIHSDRALIPLMAVFSQSSDENLRIAAAWALCMIGDRRGVNAVKTAAENDDSPRVQSVCKLYYETFKKSGKFSMEVPDENIGN